MKLAHRFYILSLIVGGFHLFASIKLRLKNNGFSATNLTTPIIITKQSPSRTSTDKAAAAAAARAAKKSAAPKGQKPKWSSIQQPKKTRRPKTKGKQPKKAENRRPKKGTKVKNQKGQKPKQAKTKTVVNSLAGGKAAAKERMKDKIKPDGGRRSVMKKSRKKKRQKPPGPIRFIPKRVLTQLSSNEFLLNASYSNNKSRLLFKLTNRTLACRKTQQIKKSQAAKKTKRKSLLKATLVQEKRAALRAFMSVMHNMSLPVFLVEGSLLGWYRECDIIGHTTDLDFGLDARRLTLSVYNQLRQFSRSYYLANVHDFYLAAMFGEPKDSWELSFRGRGGIKIDLFLAYPFDRGNSTGGYSFYLPGFAKPNVIRWEYTVKDPGLCHAILIDVPVFVPCDPLSIIRAVYGPNWATPVADSAFKYWETNNTRIVRKLKPNGLHGFYDTF